MRTKDINIAIVVYANYSRVTRVRKYAESLSREGFNIDIISLNENYTPRFNNISLIKYPLPRVRISKIWYVFEYLLFFIYVSVVLTFRNFYRHYRIIQIQNMPDFLVFTALIPRILGTKVILDMHDPMPELFMTKYHVNDSDRMVWLIKFVEKLSFMFSDKILTANDEFKRIFLKRNRFISKKIEVISNCPDPRIFKKRGNGKRGKTFNLLYMGTVDERFGLDTIIMGINLIRNKIPNLVLTVIPRIQNEGKYFQEILEYILENNLNDYVKIYSPKPAEMIIPDLRKTHIGIVPLKKSVFTELLIPVKLLEFIQMDIPIIATKTRTLSKNFRNDQICFLNKNTPFEFASALLKLYKNVKMRKFLSLNARKYLEDNNWPADNKKYLGIVNSIVFE